MAKLTPLSPEEAKNLRELFAFPTTWEVEYAQFAFNEVRDGTHDSPKEVQNGVPLVTSKNLKVGCIDFSKTKTISFTDHDEISKRSGVSEGDLLFSMIGTIGNVAVVPNNTNFSVKNVGLFRRNNKLLSDRYAFYWLLSDDYQNYLDGKKRGGNQKFVSLGVLRESPVPLPPLAEQKVIADKLDELLAQVESTKARLDAIPAILKSFRQSVLAAAVSGKLTEEWRGNSELIGWQHGLLADFVMKPTYGSSAKSDNEGLVPVLRMGNLQDGKLDWSNLVYTSDKEEISKYRLNAGDVLFNRTNSPELVGKTSIFRGEREAIYAGYLIKITCLDCLNPEYLNFHLNSLGAKEYCRTVKSDGVSQSNINAKKLAAYPMMLPPVEEQTEIVRRVEELLAFADKVEAQVNAAQARVNNLTQAILAKAFRGELTADWRAANPDLISGENSAEALLKRIKAERAKLKPVKKTTAKKAKA